MTTMLICGEFSTYTNAAPGTVYFDDICTRKATSNNIHALRLVLQCHTRDTAEQ